MSSTPMPASSSRRTASAIVPERWRIVARTTPSSISGRSRAISAITAAARSASARSAGVSSSRSPPISDFSSSDVPWAITLPWSMTTIESARRSASSRYWVVSSTVVPPATRSSIVSHRPSRLRGSRPVVGSSRNSTGGRKTSAAARSSRRRMPPE